MQEPEFGRIYVRLQTWFPFTIQIYLNGHEWLARQLLKHGIGFELRDNAFLQIDDCARAQTRADRFVRVKWIKQFQKWARLVNPLLIEQPLLCGPEGQGYDWVINQAEFSTDVMFRSRAALG